MIYKNEDYNFIYEFCSLFYRIINTLRSYTIPWPKTLVSLQISKQKKGR